MTEQEQDILFGYPIIWAEEKIKIPIGDIVLVDWSRWADWPRYLRRKEEEYEHEDNECLMI